MKQKKKVGAKSNLLFFLNRFFILVVICLVGWIGYKLKKIQDGNTPANFQGNIFKTEGTFKGEYNLKLEGVLDKPFNYYQGELDKRNFFEAPWEKPQIEKREEQVKEPPKPKIDLKTLINLVGIVLDDDPKAVIEDLKTQETVFLSIGQEINEAKLIEIHEEKIIFLYHEEKQEIFLDNKKSLEGNEGVEI
ncbi:MAG: hypothetical protein H6755_03300 [Candidatus Omnitrophica bacterium]|nr:hypothetical protein [Candidatus Omnitrophota bacterium]